MLRTRWFLLGFAFYACAALAQGSYPLWDLAASKRDRLCLSVIFTQGPGVDGHLSTPDGLEEAVRWCKTNGVTRVFLEAYRRGYANREWLVRARDRFEAAGILASGAVMPSGIAKRSTGWGLVSCYTNQETQEELKKIFEYAASMFDEVLIDDAYFTDCECEECMDARGDQTWSQYRCDLMLRMSHEQVLGPAREVNPNVKLILKYPLWYESFHDRGYDVLRQTEAFDTIWAGTETRDYDYDVSPNGKVQYSAYFIARWLSSIGADKYGGGWFDSQDTTPDTFVEQARQTVLSGAREMTLYSYSRMLHNRARRGRRGYGLDDSTALRKELPGLLRLAELVADQPITGVHAPKPGNSDAYDERYVHGFLGMMGVPLVPAHEVDERAATAFFAVHALEVPGFSDRLERMLNSGARVLITSGLASRLANRTLLNRSNLRVLGVNGEPTDLLGFSQSDVQLIRDHLLTPLGIRFVAPNKVAVYLIGDRHVVVENFNNDVVEATMTLEGMSAATQVLSLPTNADVADVLTGGRIQINRLPPRTLVAYAITRETTPTVAQ